MTGCWSWTQRICALLIALPALGGSLGPLLAPRLLPHMFPTADEVMLQGELELPLLRASFELQARLYSMAAGNYLIRTLDSPEPVTLDSAITGTMYSFARFIAAAERAMDHPDSDLGISTSTLFPYRLVARRQRVTGLIRQTLDAMGSRGSRWCRSNLVEALSNHTGALMAALAAAESATETECPHCKSRHVIRSRSICDEGSSLEAYIVASTGEGDDPWLGGEEVACAADDGRREPGGAKGGAGFGSASPGEGGGDLLQEAEGQGEGEGDGSDAHGSAPPSAAHFMAVHQLTMACDRTLILHRAQRRAIAELMLQPPGPSRRAGQLAVPGILPFHEFADLIYPVLEPLYRHMHLVSAAIQGRAAVHATSLRRARELQSRARAAEARLAATGKSTPWPVPIGVWVGRGSGVPTAWSPTWAAMTDSRDRRAAAAAAAGVGTPRPALPTTAPAAAPGPAPTPPRRADGPWVPSVARAAKAAKAATCTLLGLLSNSTAAASSALDGGAAPAQANVRRRAMLVHWMGPMASDLVRLLDPTMLCAHRERIVRVQRAALDLLQVLDAGPRIFTQAEDPEAAGALTAWDVATAPLVVTWRLALVLADNTLQVLGAYGPDAAFTDGSLAGVFSGFVAQSHVAAGQGGRGSWRLPSLLKLTHEHFSTCSSIYEAIKTGRRQRAACRAAEVAA